MNRRRWLVLAAKALAAGGAARAAQAQPAAAVIEIRDYKFIPEVLTVKAGTTVRWTNSEKRTTHSVIFPSLGGLESERMFPGDSWERKFDKPGEYVYTCGPHPEMKGKLIVSSP
jgi:plastocyanin